MLAGAIAAVCTTVVAAIAGAADVSLEVNAKAIPIPAFALWTIIGAALGVALARLLRERRRFVVVTAAAAGPSLIPAIAAPDDTATSAVLVGTHLLAAAIIILALSQRLTAVNDLDPALDQQLLEVPVGQAEPQVPAASKMTSGRNRNPANAELAWRTGGRERRRSIPAASPTGFPAGTPGAGCLQRNSAACGPRARHRLAP